MQWLANISVRRPVFATVMVLGICVLGLAGYGQLGVDRFPKIDAPFITVNTRLPGAAPEEVETEVTDKLEEALNTISGIDELRSISTEGDQPDLPQLQAGEERRRRRPGGARQGQPGGAAHAPRRRAAGDHARSIPAATPALYIAVNGKLPAREMTDVADNIVRRQIENVTGVGEVVVLGGRERQVNVWVDPLKLRAFGLTAFDVQRTLASQNISLPAGSLQAGQVQQTLRLRGPGAEPGAARGAGGAQPGGAGGAGGRRGPGGGRAGGGADAGHPQRRAGRGAVGAQAGRRQHRRGGRRGPRAHGRR